MHDVDTHPPTCVDAQVRLLPRTLQVGDGKREVKVKKGKGNPTVKSYAVPATVRVSRPTSLGVEVEEGGRTSPSVTVGFYYCQYYVNGK